MDRDGFLVLEDCFPATWVSRGSSIAGMSGISGPCHGSWHVVWGGMLHFLPTSGEGCAGWMGVGASMEI